MRLVGFMCFPLFDLCPGNEVRERGAAPSGAWLPGMMTGGRRDVCALAYHPAARQRRRLEPFQSCSGPSGSKVFSISEIAGLPP